MENTTETTLQGLGAQVLGFVRMLYTDCSGCKALYGIICMWEPITLCSVWTIQHPMMNATEYIHGPEKAQGAPCPGFTQAIVYWRGMVVFPTEETTRGYSCYSTDYADYAAHLACTTLYAIRIVKHTNYADYADKIT